MIETTNLKCYSGSLTEYPYPIDCEFCDLLIFLKQVSTRKRVHLTDINNWNMPYPDADFDIYIICAFGEFINEQFINKLDNDSTFDNKQLILITSQYYHRHNLKKFKVFYLEHMHTIVNFFKPTEYNKLSQRSVNHGLLSRRNALHKSLVLNKLLKFYPESLYTLCNEHTTEFQINTLKDDCRLILGIDLSDGEVEEIVRLHQITKTVPGAQWDIDNLIYRDSKLNWAVESIFLSRTQCPTAYLTEKIIKPIVSGCCFILVSQMDSYQRLGSWGFETFENIFQIDFDSSEDQFRLDKIYQIMESTDFDGILNDATIQSMVDYNYHYFFNGFVDCVRLQNQHRVEMILEYINGL